MTIEELPNGYKAHISPIHRFQADGVLLADFARPADGERVCDLGSGCGVIPLRWLAMGYRPRVDTVEIQPEAVALATASVAENGWDEWIHPHCADWREDILPAGVYDRVVCNPPYFAGGRKSPDPARELARREPPEGMAGWISAGVRHLRPGGRFCVCHRPERLPALLAAFRQAGLAPQRVQLIQKRENTAPWLVLCEAILGGEGELQTLPIHIEEKERKVCPEV